MPAAAPLTLPDPGEYGVGLVFFPRQVNERNVCKELFECIVRREGLRLLGWRTVPTDPSACGDLARTNMPEIRQIFIGCGKAVRSAEELERKLYVVRRSVERAIKEAGLRDSEAFYVPSLSARTLVYKGLLLPKQIPQFYADLRDPRMTKNISQTKRRTDLVRLFYFTLVIAIPRLWRGRSNLRTYSLDCFIPI